ncbi:DUF3592 domain-containing protein [Dactylosporangium sp. NPDC005555]|uniref:DUF3592 domain-containing protein n=1 Tax=Dactylosporangium sp. NPDC005555 TaxID=3154889 RepID=UPI0033A27A6C
MSAYCGNGLTSWREVDRGVVCGPCTVALFVVVNGRGDQWRRPNRGLLALAVVMLVAGLALAGGTPILLSRNRDKAERLRATGVAVDASIVSWSTQQRSDAAADYIRLTYTYDGVRYSSQTRCGGSGGCAEPPGYTLRIWVDPRDPDEFVTNDGNTDDSNLATSYLLLPAGFMTLVGGLGIWVATAFRSIPRRGHRRA